MRVDDATKQRGQLAAGQQRGQLAAGQREANREVGVDPRRGSQHQTPEQRGEAAWDRVQSR